MSSVALAASIAGLISLAGQILQGCQFIRNLLDDIRDAPEDIHTLSIYIETFQSSVQGFRQLLEQVERFGEKHGQNHEAKLALDLCNEGIQQLKGMVEAYCHSSKKELWRSLQAVSKKRAFLKCIEKLELSKTCLLVVQVNELLSLNHAHSNHIKDIATSFARLHSDINCYSQQISSIREVVGHAQSSIQRTSSALEAVLKELSDKQSDKNLHMSQMIESTIQRVLLEFQNDLQRQQALDLQRSMAASTVMTTTQNEFQSPFQRNETEQVVYQASYSRTYRRIFGTLKVSWLTTTLGDTTNTTRDRHSAAATATTTTTQVKLDFRPIPWLLTSGLLVLFTRSYLGNLNLNADMKLRVYRVVLRSASIVAAVQGGNIAEVQRHFAAKTATPYDAIRITTESTEKVLSLLDIAWEQWFVNLCRNLLVNNPPPGPGDICRSHQMFDFLVGQGIDPSADRYLLEAGELVSWPRLRSLLLLSYRVCAEYTTHVIDMGRVLIDRSIKNPFESVDPALLRIFTSTRSKDFTIFSLLRQQNKWVLQGSETCDANQVEAFHYAHVLYESPYMLHQDPDGHGFKAWLAGSHHLKPKVLNKKICDYFHNLIRWTYGMPHGLQLKEDITQRLVAWFGHAQNHSCLGGTTLFNDDIFDHGLVDIVTLFMLSSLLDVLTSALQLTGFKKVQITALYERARCSQEVLELAYLGLRWRGWLNHVNAEWLSPDGTQKCGYFYDPRRVWHRYLKQLDSSRRGNGPFVPLSGCQSRQGLSWNRPQEDEARKSKGLFDCDTESDSEDQCQEDILATDTAKKNEPSAKNGVDMAVGFLYN